MKKPDFSKQGINHFFLYHSEKLIFAASIALLAFFFWWGYSSKKTPDKTPSELVQMVKQVDQRIASDQSWEKLQTLRQGPREFVHGKKVDPSQFVSGILTIKRNTPTPRTDPQLFRPTDLIAQEFRAPLLVRSSRARDPLKDIPLAQPADEKDEDVIGTRMGAVMQVIHQDTFPGIRPLHFDISADSHQAFVTNVVAVTALVDIKKQQAEFEKHFASSVGFFPERDKPIYEFLQVQRRKMTDGKPGKWEDISQRVGFDQPRYYPASLIEMPQARFPSAPEYVAAPYYDPVITQPIPPISGFDYRPFVVHPKVETRKFDPLYQEKQEEEATEGEEIFGSFSGGSDRSDDSAESESGRGTMGVGRGTENSGKQVVRLGSDTTKYQLALHGKIPNKNYKLIRFFDLKVKEGDVYQYRVRTWLADPNHEDPKNEFATFRGSDGAQGSFGRGAGRRGGMGAAAGRGRGRSGMGLGGAGLGGGGEEEGGVPSMDDGDGDSGMPPANPDGGRGGGSSTPTYAHTNITQRMKAPAVRSRLRRAREEKDPKNPEKTIYYVSEIRTAQDGSQAPEEIQVPRGHTYLRFARPTDWSDPVEIAVKNSKTKIVAGGISPPKVVKINNRYLPSGEPTAELAPAVLSKKYYTWIPALLTVHRADALDFPAQSHVVNSVTWGVHALENAPVVTRSVAVDMLGGEEIPLPRTELMRHHLDSEVLVMDANGEFRITNDRQDETAWKRLLVLEDDSVEVGGEKAARRRKREEEKERADRGGGSRGRGGGGGIPPMDDGN